MLAFFAAYFLCIIVGMLKILSIVIIVGAVGVVVFTMYVRETNPLSMYETKTLQMGEAKLEVLIADTEEKRTKGLMGVTSLEADSGMLFIFPDSSPRTFWNKDTLIPLDLIWIANEHVVGISSLPSVMQSNNQIVTISSPEAANWVVEANAGWAQAHGIEAGKRVE